MARRFREWFWGDFFGPLNKRRFGFRIWLRVRWLYFKLWAGALRPWRKAKHFSRPLLVLFVLLAMLWLLEGLGLPLSETTDRVSDMLAGAEGAERLRWQDALLLAGAPVAFMLWWFRDIHVNETLENQRKDVNLKEFQEIQMRAAGALDEKLPARARETLEIAATHQLASFLRGEYGRSFQRPAWELLRAQLLASSERMGYRATVEQTTSSKRETTWREFETGSPTGSLIDADRAGIVQRAVVAEEWRTIFHKGLPLSRNCFDGVILPPGALLALRRLSRCSFVGAHLVGAHLEGADLTRTHFVGTNLLGAHLDGANLNEASFRGANLSKASLRNANLFMSDLSYANLVDAHFDYADLSSWNFLALSSKELLSQDPLYSSPTSTVHNYQAHDFLVSTWRKHN